ncbi:MAG: ferredoxin [Ignavibacteriae bacterium HGW-Ignavibacteriae-2]|jgi:ferredoxin|nr:MAG: ferredoxin [Ignavibacteriae bacterium HGW-Ignavibacteriae-2]
MAHWITSDCINCRACEPVCPRGAIYSNDGDFLILKIKPLSVDHFFINPAECNDCKDFNNIPPCVEICPMHCINK